MKKLLHRLAILSFIALDLFVIYLAIWRPSFLINTLAISCNLLLASLLTFFALASKVDHSIRAREDYTYYGYLFEEFFDHPPPPFGKPTTIHASYLDIVQPVVCDILRRRTLIEKKYSTLIDKFKVNEAKVDMKDVTELNITADALLKLDAEQKKIEEVLKYFRLLTCLKH